MVEVDERYKVTSGGARTCHAATTRHKFVCFDVTSRVDIDCTRSSLCQARQLSRESIGTEIRGSWVWVPRETDFISRIEKPEHNIEYQIYHLIPHHILINFKENGKWSDRWRQNAEIVCACYLKVCCISPWSFVSKYSTACYILKCISSMWKRATMSFESI